MKYKDPKVAVEARVEDLLARMTMAEKIGQMTQLDRAVTTPRIVKDQLIGMVALISLLLKFEILPFI